MYLIANDLKKSTPAKTVLDRSRVLKALLRPRIWSAGAAVSGTGCRGYSMLYGRQRGKIVTGSCQRILVAGQLIRCLVISRISDFYKVCC